jgi:hypothetical protein
MTKLYQINGRELTQIARTRLDNEDQLQEWIARDPRLIGMDLLVLGREVYTDFGGFIDILGLDRDGNLVIIECKRDLTPRDIVAQILDYASWVANLNTRDVHNIAQQKLGRPLGGAFQERFDIPLPENLNSSHSLVAVASEFDASSQRIVEYLSESHGIAINTIFFSVFEHQGQVFLSTDWLLDQEEVTERAERKSRAPWSGLWYANVGDGPNRSWEDMRRYGFLAAGGGRLYSGALGRLQVSDRVCAYQKGAGYVGYGQVTAAVVPVKEFLVSGGPLIAQDLYQKNIAHDANDPEMSEYAVGMDWKKTFPLDQAKTFTGVFANQNIVCKLRDPVTIDFLRKDFPVDAPK